VLLHCGDVVGNYGKDNKASLLQQFESFCAWVTTIAPKYQRVIFIAGHLRPSWALLPSPLAPVVGIREPRHHSGP
jgi:hypothetical protein